MLKRKNKRQLTVRDSDIALAKSILGSMYYTQWLEPEDLAWKLKVPVPVICKVLKILVYRGHIYRRERQFRLANMTSTAHRSVDI